MQLIAINFCTALIYILFLLIFRVKCKVFFAISHICNTPGHIAKSKLLLTGILTNTNTSRNTNIIATMTTNTVSHKHLQISHSQKHKHM